VENLLGCGQNDDFADVYRTWRARCALFVYDVSSGRFLKKNKGFYRNKPKRNVRKCFQGLEKIINICYNKDNGKLRGLRISDILIFLEKNIKNDCARKYRETAHFL
jgi:hypothetical protein